jgi:hypothetical protein
MRVYYRGSNVLVTDDVFVWRTEPPRIFAIRDLHDVRIVHDDAPMPPASGYVGAGALAVIAAGWPLIDNPAAYVAAFLLLALPGAATILCWRMRPRRWQLRAEQGGQDVTLFTATDATVFGQVARALRRALEASGPAPHGYQLAGP